MIEKPANNENEISFAEYFNKKNGVSFDCDFSCNSSSFNASQFSTSQRKPKKLTIEELKRIFGQHLDVDTDTGIFRMYPEMRKTIKEILKDAKPTNYELDNDSDTETFRTLVDLEKGNL